MAATTVGRALELRDLPSGRLLRRLVPSFDEPVAVGWDNIGSLITLRGDRAVVTRVDCHARVVDLKTGKHRTLNPRVPADQLVPHGGCLAMADGDGERVAIVDPVDDQADVTVKDVATGQTSWSGKRSSPTYHWYWDGDLLAVMADEGPPTFYGGATGDKRPVPKVTGIHYGHDGGLYRDEERLVLTRPQHR